ncbi:MAG: right-handed parallel beta-helix repeat-containing protein [Phycisphaerales bacterium]
MRAFVIGLGTLWFVGAAQAGVLFVRADLTTGANNGASWADAFQGRFGVQAALGAAQAGDDIWVAQGVYAPAGANGDITVSFNLKSGVRLLGGFAGNESSEAQRDPVLRVTTLTGDLNSNDLPEEETFNKSDNSAHVVRADGAAGSGTLDGFTVRAGFAEDRLGGTVVDRPAGGGLLAVGASPMVRGCRFTDNGAQSEGGGIAAFGGAVLIDGCHFTGNRAWWSGAGVSSRSGAATVVQNCRFTDTTSHGAGARKGWGIAAGDGITSPDPNPGSIIVRGCEFSIQTTPFDAPDGIGIGVSGGTARIERCRFIRCTGAGSGGGVSASNATVEIDRCLFAENEGRFDGGAAIYSFENVDYTVTNCVFTGNDREGFSTIHVQGGGVLRLTNCTMFDNGAPTGVHFPLLIGNVTACTVHNCIFNANKSGNPVTLPLGVKFGTGTINVASSCVEGWNNQFPSVATFDGVPGFVNAAGADGVTGTADDDLRLGAASVCVDRGNNSLVPTGVLLDVAGLPRFRDIAGVPDLGVGPAPVVDIGAHERAPTCPTDLDGDGQTNTADLVLFLGSFGQTVAPFVVQDLDGSGTVNTADLVVFLGGFGLPCP